MLLVQGVRVDAGVVLGVWWGCGGLLFDIKIVGLFWDNCLRLHEVIGDWIFNF